jgi:fibronectin-binding autotransporter adhesin
MTSGNWANAAHWVGGALPDAANVAAVTIPAGVNVIYSSAVGSTQLTTLTSLGNLTLTGGTLSIGNTVADTSNIQNATLSLAGGQLTINGSLQSGILRLSNGTLNGSGNLTSADFGQTGGAIAGTLSNLTLASLGNFTLANSLAATQSIDLSSGGSILDALPAGAAATLSAPSVRLSAATGAGTVAVPLRLATTALSGSTTGGLIQISNTPTGTVTLSGLSTGNASNILYAQNGRALNITGGVRSAGGGIVIDPPTDLTMSPTATITSGGGGISLDALGNITLAAVNAGSGAVVIQTTGGQIGTATPGVNNVTAGDLTLNASTGIQLAYVAPATHVSNTSGTFALTNTSTGVTTSNVIPTAAISTPDTINAAQTAATVIQQTMQTPVPQEPTTAPAVVAPVPSEPALVLIPVAPAHQTTDGEAVGGNSPVTTASSDSRSPQTSRETERSEGKPKESREEKSDDKPATKPAVQTVTVANATVQKPAEQVMQVERPKGRVLVCKG